LDRLGLWTALTFEGSSPDLVTEEDVKAGSLAGYKIVVLVGDSLPPALVPELEKWVRAGGVVLATATAGQFDPYRAANPGFASFLGLAGRSLDGEAVTFLRPRQELPFLRPLAQVKGEGWQMPQIAVPERVKPAEGVRVLAEFEGGKGPAFLERKVGKGRVFYVAAHPGLAYLWSALQPPRVPDRGPASHSVPTRFDEGARALVKVVLAAGKVEPALVASPRLLDARLLKAEKGFILPVANYSEKLGEKATLSVAVPRPVGKVVSAYHGELKFESAGGRVTFVLPALGAGDAIRLEPK
jgi:hypothetical protein